MATKKGKGRGGWVKTQSISSKYSKNTLAHVEELSSKSLAPDTIRNSSHPLRTTNNSSHPPNCTTKFTCPPPPQPIAPPKNVAATPTGPSIERAPATRRPTPQEIPATRQEQPTILAIRPTAPPNSRATTITYETEVTSARIRARAPTPIVAHACTLRPSSSHAVDPNTEEIESLEIRGSPLIEEDHDDSATKNTRGITQGLDLHKRRRLGERIEIDISADVMRAIGKNCQLYITDVGCIVRKFAPLQVKGWSKIPRNEVETLILRVREKFKLSTEPHVDVAIEEDMKRRYTRWRYTLHQMFLECKTVKQALANPPVEVDVEDWKYLVKLWQDERWKDEMDRLRTNPPEELQHMSEDEIYDHVLGEAPSGYIRGLGPSPKPKPSAGVAARRCAQVEAAIRRAEEAEAQSTKLVDESTTVKTELAEMRSNFNQQLLDIQAQLRGT
ncbi:hypothetical protein LWI28_018223 [Acer negundo]|uniref:Uncharacterized protein n=1 Tax=Acer negundo TaxID=4023 RepID=A0AAD5NK14_ACENE|nr:hypothetical protein LWI28_018223 [Acer negundo]